MCLGLPVKEKILVTRLKPVGHRPDKRDIAIICHFLLSNQFGDLSTEAVKATPMNRKKRLIIASMLAVPWLFSQASAAEFKFGAHSITVPDGFEVELIAGPPLVERPVSADFDDQGRLYVTDSSGSNDAPEKQLKDKPHRVVRLEDTRGDGRFDKSTVFADRMMFPEGAMWFDGSLYVGAPPSIWKLTDTDGDGIADKREEWMQGKTLTGCANDLHGPYAGPDGWIYWCKGAFAKQTYERPGKDPFITRAAHIFRCRPDGAGIEAVMTGGMDNPVGVAFTATGERILCCTFLQDPGGGKRDGLIHAIYGGVYGKVHDVIDEHPRTGDIMPVLKHFGPAAPCSVIRYASSAFGPEYQNNLFTCLFNLRKVERDVLVPDGATFKTVDTDFVTSDDPDFHPTCVIEDADGSLIVLNTGGWYKLCCPTSQLAKPDVLGEIYRVRRQGAPSVQDPRGASMKWETLTSAGLVKLLADPRPAVRKRAIRQLARAGNNSIEALAISLRESTSAEARRNALWALTRMDAPEARTAARDALMDQDSTVRHVAVQSISLWRDEEAGAALLSLLRDEDLQVRRNAAEALGRIGHPAAVSALLKAAEQFDPNHVELGSSARILEHSIIFALIEISAREATVQGLSSENPRVRRAALLALDQMRDGRLSASVVTPLLSSTNPVLKDTADWIIGRHSDWASALAGFFQERFKSSGLSASEVADFQAQLAPFTANVGIQELLSGIVADGRSPKWARMVALKAMADADPQPLPARWLKEVAEILQGQDVDLVREGLATARTFTLSKARSPELDKVLVQIGGDEGATPEMRLEALAAAGPLEDISPKLLNFLLANVDSTKPWAIRNGAASVLSRARLDREQLLKLADTMRDAGPAELTKLLTPFETSSDEAVGNSLVKNLSAAKAISSVRAEVLKPVIEKYPEAVRRSAVELVNKLGTDAVKQKEHIDQLLSQLPIGDIRRGQAIFNNPKVACSTCHAIGYLGGHVGPDLTSVGTIRTERDLLESIVYPSASFVRNFEPMIVRTKTGDDYNGVVRKDSAEEVILATGPETEVHIARSDIVEMHQGTVSIMPQGLDTQLTMQELADLVTFLKNTRWGAR
jgi:putative membrane-bound dehydrogenase-like protein